MSGIKISECLRHILEREGIKETPKMPPLPDIDNMLPN